MCAKDGDGSGVDADRTLTATLRRALDALTVSHADRASDPDRRHEEWLADKDTDQYQHGVDPAVVRRSFDQQISSGQFYGWQTDGRIVAIAALTDPDAELWAPEEVAEPQIYIGRLYVAEGEHGKVYGSAMLDPIADKARTEGKRWVRLNCWTTNNALHAYYEAHGYEHVRTADVPGRMSGALFQLRL